MPAPSNIVFNYKELATLMVKDQGIKDGHWGIYMEFGLQGATIDTPAGMVPSAIVGAVKIGIQRFDAANPMTVDASEVSKKG